VLWVQGTPEKLRLEPMPEQLQRCGRPHLLWHGVPNGRCSNSKSKYSSTVYLSNG